MVKPWRKVNLSHRLAGGGWISTSEDLARFAQGFMDSEYLPDQVRQEFWTPQKLNNGEVNDQNYAIGWRRHQLDLGDEQGSVTYYHHGGVSRGAQSFLMAIPEYGYSLAVNINAKTESFSDFAKIAGEITRLYVNQLATIQAVIPTR